jgi:tetratricopeptide (TPR) repeat protein
MKRPLTALLAPLLLLGGLLGPPAIAGDVEDGLRCLDETDLLCAREVVDRLRESGAKGRALDLLEGRVRFHEGDAEGAAALLGAVAATQPDDEQLAFEAALAERTARVQAAMVETTVGEVTVVHHPGVDRILVDGTLECLARAREKIAPLLGGDPPVPLRVEIYPDGASFVAASSLPASAVKTTGVIAISKWNRLLITSPRALGRGYGWQDTIAHEWIHLVVSYHARDKAPVWLQEGIAKSLDMLWRSPEFELPVHGQAALARALRDGDFVTFEEMHPSMAFLPSAERTALAYAQVATMMEFLRQERGQLALVGVIEAVSEGVDARDAVARAWAKGMDGAPDDDEAFEGFEIMWRTFIGEMDLVQERLASLPVVLDGAGDEFADDPTLSAREDLAGRARLGDLMIERGHLEAGLRYFQEAAPEDEPLGPVLALRTARALRALERTTEATALLRTNLGHYPEYAATHELLAELLRADGDDDTARAHFEASAAINPYDTGVHQALVELYEGAGSADLAARHRGYLDVLTYRDMPSF